MHVSLLLERIKPYVNEIIRDYQCGFRKGISTVNHIFALKQARTWFYWLKPVLVMNLLLACGAIQKARQKTPRPNASRRARRQSMWRQIKSITPRACTIFSLQCASVGTMGSTTLLSKWNSASTNLTVDWFVPFPYDYRVVLVTGL